MPPPRDNTNAHNTGRVGRPDPVAALLDRDEARHHSELVETRTQLHRLLSLPPSLLVASLDDDLAALATGTVEAMSVLRRNYRGGNDPPTTSFDEVAQAVAGHLAQLARLTRSALATHLTLEAQIRTSQQ